MKIIGLNYDGYISSAALIDNGEIIAAAPEERFSRIKHTKAFPINAIEFCLNKADCKIDEIDYFVSSWNPGVYLKKYNPLFSGSRRSWIEHLYSVPDNILRLFEEKDNNVEYINQKIKLFEKECDIYFVTHHRAHAANAYLLSPFKEAAILTADGWGEYETCTFSIGKENKIELIDSILYPQSIGMLYSTFTEYLGFRPDSDEWKVMALASMADWNNKYYKIIKNEIVTLLPDGKFELNLGFFNEFIREQPNFYSEKFLNKFGPPRLSNQALKNCHYEIASAMQKIAEEIVFHMIDWLYKVSNMKNITLSGGFFMNSVLNGKIIKESKFNKVFISSCPDDSGNALGAAFYLYNHILNNKKRYELKHNFFGPKYDNKEIKKTLDKYNVNYQHHSNIEAYCSKLLNAGKLVGFFQGAMEFGQRALGNRSILADPRDINFKDKVNSAVKYRESFRPFAPAILEDYLEEYFEVNSNENAHFMEKVFMIREDKQAIIPAVTHFDGSGRAQTVSKKTNPIFYKVIKEFQKITGVPVILNTSFNLNGEPIVCSITDAIRTFHSCGLDSLIIGNYCIEK